MEDAEQIGPDALLLRGFVDPAGRDALHRAIALIETGAQFRHYETPRGRSMSVAMTAAGALGWVSDRSGYRYAPADPETGRPWPDMPPALAGLATAAARVAGFASFDPDTLLVNRYAPRTALSLHQDRDEEDRTAPIVSVSLGLPAIFLWGGPRRSDPVRRVPLADGDVAVWGGASRFAFHGVAPLRQPSPLLDGTPFRLNLTFRRVRAAS